MYVHVHVHVHVQVHVHRQNTTSSTLFFRYCFIDFDWGAGLCAAFQDMFASKWPEDAANEQAAFTADAQRAAVPDGEEKF